MVFAYPDVVAPDELLPVTLALPHVAASDRRAGRHGQRKGDKRQMAEKSAKFEIYQGDDNAWRWRLKAPNGEILASGQGFREKRDCERSVNLVKMYAPEAEVLYV